MFTCPVLSCLLCFYFLLNEKSVLFLGVPVTESDVIRFELDPSERIYWSVFESLRSIFASSFFCSSYCLFDNDISSFLAKQNVSILFLVCFANRQ